MPETGVMGAMGVPEGGGSRLSPPSGGAPPGAITIGVMSGGAVASGTGARAVDASQRQTAPEGAAGELLEAVRELREHLRILTPSDDVRTVDGELAQVEEELTDTGGADRGRLARLRERLELGSTAAAGLASAAGVAQAIGQMLG